MTSTLPWRAEFPACHAAFPGDFGWVPVSPAGARDRSRQIMQVACAACGAELAGFNGEADHMQLPVNFPPKVAVSRLVNSLKGVSSRRMRQEFPDLARHYWRARRLWSGSYFAGPVGRARSRPCGSTSTSKTAQPARP